MRYIKEKKWIGFLTIIALAALFFVAGCGGDDGAAEEPAGAESPSEAPASSIPPVEGERYETDTVSMIVADGWDVMDIDGGLQAYKGSEAVEVWVRGSGLSESDAESAMTRMMEQYDGTDVATLDAFGLTFYTTFYNFSGMEQTRLSAVKDGTRIEIGLTGPDHTNNDIIMGMLDSIVIK